MKSKKISKRLQFKKETVVNLDHRDLLAVRGGVEWTSLLGNCQTRCDSNCTHCCGEPYPTTKTVE